MGWDVVYRDAKLVASLLPAQMNPAVLTRLTLEVCESGFTKEKWLNAMLARQTELFVDDRTRPIAVLFLTAMLSLQMADRSARRALQVDEGSSEIRGQDGCDERQG